MANSFDCTKRLQKEYQLVQKTPTPNIHIKVDPNNIKMWYFLIHSLKDCDYANGVYMGSVKIPDQYPMKAPVFQMITPSGRFQTYQALCTTFSHYHPEQWSPNWKIQTTLVGLMSFMLEDGHGIGSILRDSKERKQLAAESVAFNYTNNDFKNIFLEDFPRASTLVADLAKLNQLALEAERISAKTIPAPIEPVEEVVNEVPAPVAPVISKPVEASTMVKAVVKEMTLNAIIWTYLDSQMEEKSGESVLFEDFCKRLAKWATIGGYKPSDHDGKITKKTVHEELKMICPDDYIKGKKINNRVFTQQ